MSRYRCDCGDTECPSCGGAQGTYECPDIGGPPDHCEGCGKAFSPEELKSGIFICADCVAEIAVLIRQTA